MSNNDTLTVNADVTVDTSAAEPGSAALVSTVTSALTVSVSLFDITIWLEWLDEIVISSALEIFKNIWLWIIMHKNIIKYLISKYLNIFKELVLGTVCH